MASKQGQKLSIRIRYQTQMISKKNNSFKQNSDVFQNLFINECARVERG